MKQDIDFILGGWEFKPGMVQARLVQGRGRQVIQMRVDLGVLQLETEGRPDGAQPHGQETYFEHLREQARMAARGKHGLVLSEEQCQEADREFVQFYHRRICWLALRNYSRAIQDADHTLAFMDFVKRHSPSDDYTQAHEQYRGFVLFQRTQAAAAWQVEQDKPDRAVDEVRVGLDQIKDFFAAYDMEEQLDEDGMVQHLRSIEKSLREQYDIGETLHEQLDRAIAEEDYERAAELRDQLKRRT